MQKSRRLLVDQISLGDRAGSPLAGDCFLEIARKRASYDLNGYGLGLGHLEDLIGMDVGQRLDRAAGPLDLDLLHNRRLAEPEVDSRIPLAQEARGTAVFLNVGLPASRHFDE